MQTDDCLITGGKCGSTYIDRNFILWMKLTFREPYISLPEQLRGPGSEFMKSFEEAKKRFGSLDALGDIIEIAGIRMDTPTSALYDNDEGYVKLPR